MRKEYIPDEFRHTVLANGGEALGHREFGKATGIREKQNEPQGRLILSFCGGPRPMMMSTMPTP